MKEKKFFLYETKENENKISNVQMPREGGVMYSASNGKTSTESIYRRKNKEETRVASDENEKGGLLYET